MEDANCKKCKKNLREWEGFSSASIAKLSKGTNISTDVLLKLSVALDCKVEDIMETIKD